MTKDEAGEFIKGIMAWKSALIIFPDENNHPTLRAHGLDPETQALVLYAMADAVLKQRVPLNERFMFKVPKKGEG